MKHKILLFLVILLPAIAFGQQRIVRTGTMTAAADTIVRFKVTDIYAWSLHLVADTLTGTKDATVEIVVANNPSSITTSPADSLFVRYSANMVDTLSSQATYSFFDSEGAPYEWIGFKVLKNNMTDCYIRWKLVLQK